MSLAAQLRATYTAATSAEPTYKRLKEWLAHQAANPSGPSVLRSAYKLHFSLESSQDLDHALFTAVRTHWEYIAARAEADGLEADKYGDRPDRVWFQFVLPLVVPTDS
jgi:hypothetical protein